MVQYRVIIVGTSPAETLRLEEALQQTGCLDTFRYVGLEQALDRVPNWDECDLLMARYQERTGSALLSLLSPVLRKSLPPVIFLVDPFEPVLVNRLLNLGARRVLPVYNVEQVLDAGLAGISGIDIATGVMSNLSWPGKKPPVELDREKASSRDQAAGFARLFRSSPIGISVNRLRDGVCLDCNESFARLLEWQRDDLIGREVLELGIPPEIQQAFSSPSQEAPSLPVRQYEHKIYTRSRKARNIQVHLDLIDWEGEECLLSLVQDITEKEQAKEKVKRLNDELERLFLVRTGALHAANRELAAEIGRRQIVEDFSNQLTQIIWETPDMVAICAPDGRMQFLNKSGRKLFGLNEDEPVSHLDLFSAYPENVRKWVEEEIQPTVIQKGIWRGETTFSLSNGCAVPISQVLLCKKDDAGKVQFFAYIARDVSDFKRVEQELRQSRERYRILAEAAHDIIFMVSKDGLMEYANGYTCQVLGVDPDNVAGLPAVQFFPRDFAANHQHMFTDVREIDRPIYTEGPFTQDGKEAWVGTWLVPIYADGERLVSILGISRDITEQKKTDEALQHALDTERELGEMRSNFFSMTSHQFRTPLSTIMLSTELLLKYSQKWDDQKRDEHLNRIQDSARRLNGMLENILVIGRVESGRYVYSPKEFDLVEFCDQTIQEISINDHNEHDIVLEHDQDQIPVSLDPELMHRVIDNLLSNAIKYSQKGTRVTVSMRLEDADILLEVTDQGIGIPDRDLKYLFQPFQRGSNAGDFPGTGIGLTIIQKSVDLLSGTVSLKSKEGQGTTFMVRIPVRLDTIPDRALS